MVADLDVDLPDGGGELGFDQVAALGDLDVGGLWGGLGGRLLAGELAGRFPGVALRAERRALPGPELGDRLRVLGEEPLVLGE